MKKQQYPEPTVGALIYNKKGQILLMKSHKWRGKWVVPGGHVELQEKLEDAVKREVKEETGLDVYDLEFICFQEFIFDNVFWKKKHFIFFDYACKAKNENVKLNKEAQEYKWVSIKEALKMDLEPYTTKTILEKIKKRKREK